jgi:hypothetical protein
MRTRYFFSVLVLALVFSACQKEVKQIPVSSTPVSSTPASSADVLMARKVKTVDPVTISWTGFSTVSIDITVAAGLSTGAPTGFTIQWATAAQLAAYPGPVDTDGWPLDTSVFCKASFSSKASGMAVSRYGLKPGQSVTVRIGNLLPDNGASTTCPDNLIVNTAYVFRAFANANHPLLISPWSNILPASTSAGNSGAGGI